ncbi:MAG: hypothetical protein QW552_03420 [Ignisphaera sp.]
MALCKGIQLAYKLIRFIKIYSASICRRPIKDGKDELESIPY